MTWNTRPQVLGKVISCVFAKTLAANPVVQ